MHVRQLARRRLRRAIAPTGTALIATLAVAIGFLTLAPAPVPAVAVPATTPSGGDRSASDAGPVARMLADFQDPPAAFRPVYRYWHPGGRMDPDTLRAEFHAIRAGGAGGVELANFVRNNSIAPIADYDADTEGFGTPAWRERFTDAVRIGREEGLQVDSTYTSKYSANLYRHSRRPRVGEGTVADQRRLAPGEAYAAALPRPTLPTPDVTRAQPVAVRAYPCLSGCDAGTPVIDRQTLVALTRAVQDDRLVWQAPSGDSLWVVVASWIYGTGQQVEGEETPGNSYLVDHLNRVGHPSGRGILERPRSRLRAAASAQRGRRIAVLRLPRAQPQWRATAALDSRLPAGVPQTARLRRRALPAGAGPRRAGVRAARAARRAGARGLPKDPQRAVPR